MECKNILVVEDDQAICQTIKDVLEIWGYQVFLASNGKEGVEKLKDLQPLPCVVLLDLMMPGTSGWDFLDMQRGDPQLRKVPVVICSAYHESAKAIKLPVVQKPLKFDELMGAIKSFCA